MTTEAGKRLLAVAGGNPESPTGQAIAAIEAEARDQVIGWLIANGVALPPMSGDDMVRATRRTYAAIEAEAVAAERTRIAEAMGTTDPRNLMPSGARVWIDRAAVLAIVNGGPE